MNTQSCPQPQNKEYLDSLNVEMKREADEGFSQEDALKKVNEMLKDLSIKDFTVTDCVKAIGTEDSESWAGLEDGELTKSVGYSVYLSPKAGDVAGYTLPRRMVYNDLPRTMYSMHF